MVNSSHQARNGDEVCCQRSISVSDCFGQSNSENSEGIDGAIHAYHGKTRFNTEGFKDVGAVMVMGEAIPGPGTGSSYI